MKKLIFLSLGALLSAFLLLIVLAIYISFTIVKPTTESINRNLAKFLSRIIYIPEGIPPPIFGYDQTSYFWEMETTAGEVTGIRFSFTPSYAKDQNTITAILEMPERGDASIFTKVLPSVISDQQSLISAQDPQKANLANNPQVGYREIKLTAKPETSQTIKIVWEFDKRNLDERTAKLYMKLDKYPQYLLKILYGVPSIILGLLGG